MPPPQVEVVTGLREYTALIERLMGSFGGAVWYRGCGSATFPLIPSLYRHPTISDTAQLVTLESQVLARFKQRSLPYHTRVPADDWDYLFLMQHVGVPTRLLDWSENPYIALYFAITDAERLRERGTQEFLETAVVWALDPGAWNRSALAYMSFTGDVLSVADAQLDGYAPAADTDYMNNEPVALYGMHNSPRIVAQRGVFTIFGRNSDPVETTYESLAFPSESLVKIEIPATAIEGLRSSVFSIGYSESVIFPDLDGLAREIRRQFGFVI